MHIGATPFLGISVQPAAFDTSARLLVAKVVPSSPADRAGISSGDTLTSLNGRTIDTPALLTSLLLRHPVGETIRIGVVDQYGNSSTATVTLGSGPPQ